MKRLDEETYEGWKELNKDHKRKLNQEEFLRLTNRPYTELIQSILDRYPIPSIFLYRREENGRPVYDVLDGKQRLETVFLDGAGSASSSVTISIAGSVSAGDTRAYQYWFRDPDNVCGGGFNFSNGWIQPWF